MYIIPLAACLFLCLVAYNPVVLMNTAQPTAIASAAPAAAANDPRLAIAATLRRVAPTAPTPAPAPTAAVQTPISSAPFLGSSFSTSGPFVFAVAFKGLLRVCGPTIYGVAPKMEVSADCHSITFTWKWKAWDIFGSDTTKILAQARGQDISDYPEWPFSVTIEVPDNERIYLDNPVLEQDELNDDNSGWVRYLALTPPQPRQLVKRKASRLRTPPQSPTKVAHSGTPGANKDVRE